VSAFFAAFHFTVPGTWWEAALLCVCLVITTMAFTRITGPGAAALITLGAAASFLQIGDVFIPAAVALVGVVLIIRGRTRDPVSARRFARDMAFLLAGFLAYEFMRFQVIGSETAAIAHAHRVVHTERTFGLFFEPRLQDALTSSDAVTAVLNLCYSHLFLAAVISAVVWVYLTDREHFRLLRTGLGVSVLCAVVIIVVFPTAPPRLVPGLGITDTVVQFGSANTFANPYAAEPSLHVGWLALIGWTLSLSQSGWRRWAVLIGPGLAMELVVIGTGNHYWVDGVVGSAISIGPAALLRRGPLAMLRPLSWRPMFGPE
jgi:hypothetical protein